MLSYLNSSNKNRKSEGTKEKKISKLDLPKDSIFNQIKTDEILENENRTNIMQSILKEPGIHFNELLRRVGVSVGTLAWHLDILEKNKFIQKRRIGQYLLYFSAAEKNPLAKLDSKLSKSKTTLSVLDLITRNPGIYQSQIAKHLNLHHKTIKYHLNKLIKVDAIYSETTGRRTRFYPILKIILCGDGGIGKTSLATFFCKRVYQDHDITIALDIHVKKVTVKDRFEIMQVWDLSGQQEFRFFLHDFFQGVDGVVLAFDLSNQTTFQNLTKWLEIIPQVPIYLIATKADKGYHPNLTREIIEEFVKQNNIIGFTETSAKANLNVETPFIRLTEHIKGFIPQSVPITFSQCIKRPKSIGFWFLAKDSGLTRIRVANFETFLKSKNELELFTSFLINNAIEDQ